MVKLHQFLVVNTVAVLLDLLHQLLSLASDKLAGLLRKFALILLLRFLKTGLWHIRLKLDELHSDWHSHILNQGFQIIRGDVLAIEFADEHSARGRRLLGVQE